MDHSVNNLGIRTVELSKQTIAFCGSIRMTPVNRPMVEQLIKAVTSVGANYAEANNAASKNDFKNKIFIAKKEAAEAEYWLKLFIGIVDEDEKDLCIELRQECHYILMTLQKIINTLNRKKKMVNLR